MPAKKPARTTSGQVFRGSGGSVQVRGRMRYPTGFSRAGKKKVYPLPTAAMHKQIGAAKSRRGNGAESTSTSRSFLPVQPIKKRDFGKPKPRQATTPRVLYKGEQKMKPLKINRGTVSRRAN